MEQGSEKQLECGRAQQAVAAADRLIDRLQDIVTEQLNPETGDLDEGFGQLIEELETAPEIRQIREAAGEDPRKFGRFNPAAEEESANGRENGAGA